MTENLLVPLSASLHHITLESPAPDRLAAFYERAMQMELTGTQEGILGSAKGRKIIFVPGTPKTLACTGFAVASARDIDSLCERLKNASIAYAISAETSVLYQAGAVSFRDLDGNQLVFGVSVSERDHPNEVLPARLQHFVVASMHAAELANFYQNVVGFIRSDDVLDESGDLRTTFLRCSNEHHSFAVFQTAENRFDHHCYEAGDWGLIRDWSDHFAALDIPVVWGPGRHGPGNNLFLFIHDLDDNWLEISAELEIVAADRPVGKWPHVQKTLNQWGSAPLRS